MSWSILSHGKPYQSRAGFWFIDTVLQDGDERRTISTKYSRDLPAPDDATRDAVVNNAVTNIYNVVPIPLTEAAKKVIEALRSTTDEKAALQAAVAVATAEVTKIDAKPVDAEAAADAEAKP